MILTPHFLILLIIFITWAKAGLAGDWLLFTIDCITILEEFSFKPNPKELNDFLFNDEQLF